MAFAPLQDRLKGPIAEGLKSKLGKQNLYALPRIEKVTVNVGINKTKMESREMHEYIADSLKLITGQQPVFCTARIAISNFKIREGSIVGAMVTLRGKAMYAFLDKLLHVALPRVRDFRGVTTKLDGHGNYSIGLREHTVFPEVPPPDAGKIFGLQITITTTADSDDEARELFRAIGMPFRKPREEEADAKEAGERAKKKGGGK
jgi:large subunit ribosomal protein L5